MTLQPGKSNGLRLLGLVLAMTAVLATLGVVWRQRFNASAVRNWQDELAIVTDGEARTLVREFAEMGDEGVAPLVAALASDRQSVRDAAAPVLLEEVNRWELLPASEAEVKLAALAHGLAQSAARFSAPERAIAAELATRVILWPSRRGSAERSTILADCESVLVAANSKPVPEQANRQPPEDFDAIGPWPQLARLSERALPIEAAVVSNPIESPSADIRLMAASGDAGSLKRVRQIPVEDASGDTAKARADDAR